MARTIGAVRPLPLLGSFLAFVVGIYALVWFTGDHKHAPKLGIDLQGGTSITLTARTPNGSAPDRNALKQAQNIIETRVNGLGVAGSEVLIDGNNLVITVPGDDGSQARSLGQTARLFIRPVLASVPRQKPATAPVAVKETPDVTAQRIAFAKKTRQSSDETDIRAAMEALDCGKQDPLRGNDDPALSLVTCAKDGAAIYYLGPSLIDGQDIDNASSGFDNQGAQFEVSLSFKTAASEKWAKFTAENLGKQAAFTLDSQVISAPVVQGATPVGSATRITGNFTSSEAKELSTQLKYGSLPLSFESSDATTVSATLGLQSLKAGLLAGAIGLIAVLLYCLFYYRMLGVLTALSLVASGTAIYGILVLLGRWIGFTLDLAGIAGLIIGVGMTADSFVVYFERIKDEIREGRSFRSAVPRGWVRARRTILSGNAVSLIAAAVLYAMAAGQVKGFAFTLGLTAVLDLVVVFLVTSPLVQLASETKFWAKPSINGLGTLQQVAREQRTAENAALVGGAK